MSDTRKHRFRSEAPRGLRGTPTGWFLVEFYRIACPSPDCALNSDLRSMRNCERSEESSGMAQRRHALLRQKARLQRVGAPVVRRRLRFGTIRV
jgi:hypothetical protein